MDVTSNPGSEPAPNGPEDADGGRSFAQRVRDREERAWDLRCQGDSQTSIAKVLGIPQPLVQQILNRVAARVLDEPEDNARRDLFEAVGHCELLFEMAIAGWKRSM